MALVSDHYSFHLLFFQCATHRGFGYKITVDPPLSVTDIPTDSSSHHLLPTIAIQLTLVFITVIAAIMM